MPAAAGHTSRLRQFRQEKRWISHFRHRPFLEGRIPPVVPQLTAGLLTRPSPERLPAFSPFIGENTVASSLCSGPHDKKDTQQRDCTGVTPVSLFTRAPPFPARAPRTVIVRKVTVFCRKSRHPAPESSFSTQRAPATAVCRCPLRRPANARRNETAPHHPSAPTTGEGRRESERHAAAPCQTGLDFPIKPSPKTILTFVFSILTLDFSILTLGKSPVFIQISNIFLNIHIFCYICIIRYLI